MKLSISQKLVAAFVSLTVVVLIATLGLARWSFQQGFLDYVNALEQTRLERVQVDFAEEYLATGRSWESLTEQRFVTLLNRSAPPELLNRPPPGRLAPGGVPPGGRLPPPGAGPGQQRSGAPPVALYNTSGDRVAGIGARIDSSQAISVPIVIDDIVVGELRSEPRRELASAGETEFSKQQLNTSWILGLTSLTLAFGISLFLSRGLLAPVKQMLESVARLSGGDYTHRMDESRSDELGQLTRDLDRLGSTLEANQSSRKRLLADVSHELRTPLTILSGEIEALKDGLREFDETQLESLDQEVRRLRHLVDDLYELSVSDVGGLSYQFASVDLAHALESAIVAVQQRAESQGIALTQETPEAAEFIVEADAQRIDQLLRNILENSLVYTDAPGRVTVALSRLADSVLIAVEDTPPGVSKDDCEQLFDPLFRQEASRSRRTGGAGLGLAICRNIVTAHGGSISAAPSELGGLRILIEFPVSGDRRA